MGHAPEPGEIERIEEIGEVAEDTGCSYEEAEQAWDDQQADEETDNADRC